MAETIVEFVLNELFQVLKEEFNLQRGVKKELESVKDELESIRAFLKYIDANKLEYLQDARLETWVKQVRDVAFDIEDVVDEFLLRFANRQGNDGDDSKTTCVGSICSSIRNWRFNHRIGSELQSIKAKVVEIAERSKRYEYSSTLPNQAETSNSTKEMDQLRSKAILVDESQLVGTGEPKKELMKLLSDSDSNLKVIAIVGMGGLGKTTLANQIYSEKSIKDQFKTRAFVTVSQSLKEEELLKDMVQQLFANEKDVLEETHTMSSLRLKEKIKVLLQQRKYLIVLDDVWEKSHWHSITIGMPKNDFGSRVVITTRKEEVARYSITTFDFRGQVYHLPILSQADSWTLFCRKTFPTHTCPPHLQQICSTMLRRCGGLPLAILTLSGVLVTKDEQKIKEWEMVQNVLNIDRGANPDFNMMERVLSLSYDDLPYHLKPCFLFLSIFPEDHLIEPMRLVRLWISEGFVREKDGSSSSMTVEEIAESYLRELVNRSLIQITESTVDGRVVFYRIHDLLHETALRKCREQCFVEVINQENATKWPERVRRLSIHRYFFEHVRSTLLSRLRSLFLFQAHDSNALSVSSTMSKLLGGGFKLLNVLDLRGAPLETFPETISKLFLLKYLSLRNTKISSLPASIGNLQSLETLDLKQTYITEVPYEISNLHKLRHLLICHYKEMDHPVFSEKGTDLFYDIQSIPFPDVNYGMKMKFYPFTRQFGLLKKLHQLHGFKATPAIGGLLSLQTLCIAEVCDDDDGFINALGKLTQLRRLSLMNLKQQHWSALCSSISKMRNLRSLALHTSAMFDLEDLWSPPPLLQRLYLTGKLFKLPIWVSSLRYLQVLHLVGTQLVENPSLCLQNLPSLVVIRLYYALLDWGLSLSEDAFRRLNIGVADVVMLKVGSTNKYDFFSNGMVGFEGFNTYVETYRLGN